MLDIILKPMGWLIATLYGFVGNYGVALILFTVVIKLLLLPLTIKSQKALRKQTLLAPKVEAIKKKYPADKNKQQQLTMELYQKEDVKLLGGCLPTLIQLPIILCIYWVVSQPLKYIVGMSDELISQARELLQLGATSGEIAVARAMQSASETIFAGTDIAGFISKIPNFHFLTLDLGNIPALTFDFSSITFDMVKLWIIPVLALVFSMLSFWIPKKLKQDGNSGDQANMMGGMMKIMPFFSAYITTTVPAAVGLYWIMSSVLSVAQSIALHFIMPPPSSDELSSDISYLEKPEKAKKAKSEMVEATSYTTDYVEEDDLDYTRDYVEEDDPPRPASSKNGNKKSSSDRSADKKNQSSSQNNKYAQYNKGKGKKKK